MPVPRPRSAMRKIREILRLIVGEGHSRRAAATAPIATIADQLARAQRAGLGWPLPDDLDDAQLEARLFTPVAPPGRRDVRCPTGPRSTGNCAART